MNKLLASLALTFAVVAPHVAEARTVTPLLSHWQFIRSDVPSAKDAAFDASNWQTVDLPHTFNADDADSNGNGAYYRGPAWYRHDLTITPEAGQSYVLQFDGAALITDVYVNGQSVGHHEGGYAAFRFDITQALRAGANTIAIRVDNTKVPQIAPISGDFNVFGGLYRGVSLIQAPAVHIALNDHGGPGVYATTQSLDGAIAVRNLISNDGAASARVKVRTRILDADNKTVATTTTSQTVAPGATAPAAVTLNVKHPHLWQGRKDAYLYHVVTDIAGDEVTVPLGIRTVTVDAKNGFRLNGQPYRVYGANMQQPVRIGKGTAVSASDIDQDMQIMDDLGATALRLAHMQHPQRVYDDADAMGLLLTTEVPLVDDMTETPEFKSNIVGQMQELVAQNYNHPSVIMWGIGNEIRKGTPAYINDVLGALATTAKSLDPNRPTVYSHCCLADDDAITAHSDVISYNRYYGWYEGELTGMGDWADALHKKLPDRVFGVSEYGAGASIAHQEDPVKRPNTQATWHPEQYQAVYHESNWRQLNARPYIWSDFVWVAFDFPSIWRNEGDRPGINDKGLVTEDRETKKDAYYWYQANWSDKLMVHITSGRDTQRRVRHATIKVYSNMPEVRLSLNGESLGTQPVNDHIATLEIDLKDGDNVVEAFAGKDLHDRVVWTYQP